MSAKADIPEMMAKGLLPFLPMIVFFAGSRFLAPFTMSNPGELLAIRGRGTLRDAAHTGSFVLLQGGWPLTALGAMVLTSGAGRWTLMASVLVPMFMLLSIFPETTQALYRIGDSTMFLA